jgi:hypothetical protein
MLRQIAPLRTTVSGRGIALTAEQLLAARHWYHVVAEESVALDEGVHACGRHDPPRHDPRPSADGSPTSPSSSRGTILAGRSA